MSLADKVNAGLAAVPPWKPRPEVLTSAQIPKPMHQMAPRVVLGREWWDATRLAAYQSTDNHCIACTVSKYDAQEHKWLEGHELYQIDYKVGRMVYLETVPLCHYCHCFVHAGRTEALYKQGVFTLQKYRGVMRHGRAVLKANKLKPWKPPKGPVAGWADWRLVINGVEYPGLFKSYQEWRKGHNLPDIDYQADT